MYPVHRGQPVPGKERAAAQRKVGAGEPGAVRAYQRPEHDQAEGRSAQSEEAGGQQAERAHVGGSGGHRARKLRELPSPNQRGS